MTTPTHRRNPAVFEALKLAKLLEIYTIKKVCNEKNFSKKKYRRFLSMELINQSKRLLYKSSKSVFQRGFGKIPGIQARGIAVYQCPSGANGRRKRIISNTHTKYGVLGSASS